jgi:hypothetical protein
VDGGRAERGLRIRDVVEEDAVRLPAAVASLPMPATATVAAALPLIQNVSEVNPLRSTGVADLKAPPK